MIVARLRRLVCATMVPIALMVAGTACAAPALWKVQSPTATIYLFGTVHVLKPDVVWRTPAIDAAIRQSDSLMLEVANADDAAAMRPLVMMYGVDQAHPLSSKLDDATKARFAAVLAPLGATPAQMEPLRPWMAGVAVSTLPLLKAGYKLDSGVEHILTDEMKTAGKPVQGFETAQEQIRYLADVPPAMEMEFFQSSLSEAEKSLSIVNDLVAAWAAGDEARLETLLNAELKDKYPDIYQRLVAARNQRFADSIVTLAKGKGVVFVAVGAAHLVGADSVQADLAKTGLVAVRQ
jgi:uncharacterized protein YbaP (TraB family)